MTEQPRRVTQGRSLAPCTRLLVGTQRCPRRPPPLDCGSGAPSADVTQGDAPRGLISRDPHGLEAQWAASSLPPAVPGGSQPSWPVAGRSITPTSASDSRAFNGPSTWATGNSAKKTNPGLWPWHRLIHDSAPEDQLPLCGGSGAASGLRGAAGRSLAGPPGWSLWSPSS